MPSASCDDYQFLDCGGCRRLERFAGVLVARPAPAASFPARLSAGRWEAASLVYDREGGWRGVGPDGWRVAFGGATLALSPMASGGLGVFPEHLQVCDRLDGLLDALPGRGGGLRVLNLFAHTGLVTMRLAARGDVGEVVHVDAAGGAVTIARGNAALSGVSARWIVDDAMGFVLRESRRGSRYDVIVADPPAFGRSKKGGEWRLGRDLPGLAEALRGILADDGLVCVSCHSEGWTVERVEEVLARALPGVEFRGDGLRLESVAGGNGLSCGVAVWGVMERH